LNGIDKQKEYFELIKEVSETPVFTAKNWKEGNNYRPGKQRLVGKWLPPIDHRSIASNEIVIELDASSYAQNAHYAQMIKDYLDGQEIPHYCFWSGNKSIHIHVFLEVVINNPDGQKIVQEAVKHGCNIWCDLRMKLAKEIVEQCGMSENMIGHGKTVDLAKLRWNDIGGKTSLIRVCGGDNRKIEKDGSIRVAYKCYLTSIIPDKNKLKGTMSKNFDDVVYPKSLEKWIIDELTVIELASDYMTKITSGGLKHELESIDFKGKYMSLPCTRSILEGVKSGSRSFSCQTLAIACRLDGLDIKQALDVAKVFVSNCTQVPEPFDEEEAEKWVKWVYSLQEPYWACGQCVNLGVCSKHDCQYNKEKYKEEMAILDNDNLLGMVKKVLDELIEGEDLMKMQFFLILFTKWFDPQHFIMIDGPASAGKTHIMKEVLSLFGTSKEKEEDEDGDNIFLSRVTGAVLNYLEPGEWDNKCIGIEGYLS